MVEDQDKGIKMGVGRPCFLNQFGHKFCDFLYRPFEMNL